MKFRYWFCISVVLFFCKSLSAQGHSIDKDPDSIIVRHIFEESLSGTEIPEHLYYLTKKIGHRISGSAQAERAVKWIEHQLRALEADTVYLQPVKIPVWTRGAKERAFIQTGNGNVQTVSVLALGGSVSTQGALSAEVVEIRSWEELNEMPEEKIKGKFVFYNRAMDASMPDPFDAYLEAVDQRSIGAIEAARKGAVGALVRSLTLAKDNSPHTGAMQYAENVRKVPAAALSTLGADALSKALKENPTLKFSLEMHCSPQPDVLSHNVIAEIKGNYYPEEFITIGAHTDTWDVGEGASDDASGIVQTIEALRLFKTLNLVPKRSIRFIFYMNEESGAHGGKEYASEARKKGEIHLASIESDAGGFQPVGFRFDGAPETIQQVQKYSSFLSLYGIDGIKENQRGVDIAPMKGASEVLLSLDCESHRLFDIHHSALDTLDKLNFREVSLGAAAMTTMAYLISEYGL
ncbi:M20/M25/M40 family metallo-hydrolase [Sinomicrobium pectinilyticum]|uniref:Carboxypeptidase Q n=1 Tax=Sinomicrobium pectinilyticum TaxID=1084421 RepID=A0A3N0EWJ8_SINP1|nr:M20/M25/M40 family metallo-hydrolase [Sinomicrobium pectinilyticum]RNL92278.1 M20/M25/M40 family metallo-hydrolase [Sinomicrobium pectinilyticum]